VWWGVCVWGVLAGGFFGGWVLGGVCFFLGVFWVGWFFFCFSFAGKESVTTQNKKNFRRSRAAKDGARVLRDVKPSGFMKKSVQ